MKAERFEDWTSRGRRRGRRRRDFHRRRMIAACGIGLVLFAFVWLFVDMRVSGHARVASAPNDHTLHLTVPKMKRVKNIPVYTASSTNEAALNAGAIHLKGTGFPWEQEANVYIAGHRLGYWGTGSFLVFYDLHKLRKGDKVVLRDAEGRRYVYRVFRRLVVPPDRTSVTRPIPGKNIVSLQACTLPDYSRRLVVQAELVEVVEPPVQASAAAS
ncbi:hypothetical protein Rxycam_01240 [Rubrobacter xylanophilus DSM 9941]|uniref:sortase n=1 Tax=Rubrobacter xylanophilus TaxID=49319 RepID=UPI001C63D4BA|nr:sortase [Rubrobacter xylanophilus]QYJ15418.1 hypothetical protein Rxycam_01240 [Rubrobacter xylanophilus DSM 9941]